MTLPPGPRSPSVVQLLQWILRPLPLLDGCARRFGETFTLDMRAGDLGPFVFTTSPEFIKQIFTEDPAVLEAGKANDILRPVVGARSVLLLDGAEHLRQRRLLLPPFHGERMHAYAEIMRDVTDDSLDRWPTGRPFSAYSFTRSITLDIILRTIFGMAEGAAMAHFSELLEAFFTPPPFAIFAFVKQLQRDLPLSPFRTFLIRREAAHRELSAIIAERRKASEAGAGARADVLSLLLSARDEAGMPMSDEELRDELVTMIAAGHETTAVSMAWAFERILSTPDVAEKLQAELDSVVGEGPLEPAMLPRLPYVDAVVKETLRLRPVLPLVVRRASRPYKLGPYELPAGAALTPCIYLAHRRPDLYPDPERFLPDRFLGSKIDPYGWIPFGGGTRRCIGMAFALYEMKIVLATILSRARLRLAPGKPIQVERRAFTLAPSGGTPLVLDVRRPRRARPAAA